MSPSQAMSNHSAPSVRLHPPGLVFSLLASVPCHGLAPTLAYQALFLGKACRCFVSVWLYLFVSVCFISHPAFFFFISFSLPSLTLCIADPDLPIKWTNRLCEGKERTKKRSFFHLDDIGRSHLSSSILASWLNVYPHCSVVYSTFSFQYSLLASFS